MVAAECRREDAGVDDRCERLLHLTVRALRVARRHRHVAVVDDRQRVDDVDTVHRVVRADQRGGGANRLGPKRGPLRYEVAVSNGIPYTATSTPRRSVTCGALMKVRIPANRGITCASRGLYGGSATGLR